MKKERGSKTAVEMPASAPEEVSKGSNVQGRVKLRDKGLRKGVPDLMFLHPRADYHGLMIEMKRKDKSKCKVSKEQSMYADELTSEGYYHAFTYGLDQVKKCMKDYLAL